jgi:hypothetical protein
LGRGILGGLLGAGRCGVADVLAGERVGGRRGDAVLGDGGGLGDARGLEEGCGVRGSGLGLELRANEHGEKAEDEREWIEMVKFAEHFAGRFVGRGNEE